MKSAAFIHVRRKISSSLGIFVILSGMFFASFQVNSQAENQSASGASSELVASKKQGSEVLTLSGGFEIPAGSLAANSPGSPRVAAAADFNGDGIGDLVVAYDNALAVYRGDINAFAPNTEAAWEAIRDGRFVSSFKTGVRTLPVPIAADFVQIGDFNRDTRVDIAFAMRGDNSLFVLEGDGKANFPNLRQIETGGAITALTAADVNRLDGLPDLIVGVSNQNSAELQIFQGMGDIFSLAPQIESIPAPAESIAVGQLNENSFADIAVGTDSEVIILSGKDSAQASSELTPEILRLSQPAGVKAIVTGDLMPDRDSRTELAVLSPDGTIRIFARGSLDTRPVSQNEHLAEQVREYQAKDYPIPERILARLTKADLRKPLPRSRGDVTTWAEAETVITAAPNSRLSAQTVLTTGRVSGGAAEDLIVLDQSNGKVTVLPFEIDYSGLDRANTRVGFDGRRATQSFDVAGAPVAALAMKLNYDNEQDLLVLREDSVSPTALVSAVAATFTVNSAVDAIDNNINDGVCNTAGGVCTLRAAIMQANRTAGNDTIMINAGINPTISLGQPDNDGQGTNDQATGDLDITCNIANPSSDGCVPLAANSNNLSIIGAVGGNIVSAGTFTPYTVNGGGTINTDRVFDIGVDGIFGTGFGGSTGVSATFTNLTIQNGNVREALNTEFGGGNYAFGGGIRYDGFKTGGGHGTLTLTNTTINNNQSDNAGGGIYQIYGTHSASGSTYSNNITNAGEGGGLFFGAATSASNVNISGSTFNANEARQGTVFGTFTANADGGGLRINADPNTVTIGTTNFTNNIAQQDGGAIKTLGALVTVTGGTMTGNTARRHGGVAFGDEDTANSPAFVTFSGSTMRNNTANSDNTIFAGDGSAGDGGAVFRDRGTLNLTNCTIGGTGAGEPNTANNGGGVAHAFTVDSAPGNDSNQTIVTINGGSINGNIANTDGGGVYFNALLFDTTASTLNIGQTTATALTGNKAKNNGGGIHTSNAATANLKDMALRSNQANSDTLGGGDGGGLYQNIGTTTFTVTNLTGATTIGGSGTANSAVNGGGISNAVGTLILPASASITFNTATGNGGGINNAGTINSFTGAQINSNTATNSGGGIYNTGTITVDGATINSNTAATGSSVTQAGGTFNSSGTNALGGNLAISGGIFNSGSSIVNLGGNFGQTGGTFNGNTGTVNLGGNFSYTAGTFTPNTSTFNFNGAAAQTVSGVVSFGNLTVNNSNGVTLNSSETVNNTLTLTSGTLALSSPNTLTLNNAVAFTGGTINGATGSTVNYNLGSAGQNIAPGSYGNLTFSSFTKILPAQNVNITGTFTPTLSTGSTTTGSTITFNGAALQTIPAFNYNNLTLNNAAGANLGNSVTIGGALTLTAGNLGVGTNTLTLNGAVSAATGTLSSAATGTVIYNQSTNGQTVLSGNYGNLTFSNLTKNLTNANVGIAGIFTSGSGTHTIIGSTFTFNGATAQTLPSGFTTYNNLTLNNAAGVTGFAGLTVNGLLRVQAGTFTSSSTYNNVQIDSGATLAGTNATTINVGGNWTNNGTFAANTNTVNFNGAAAQIIGGTSPTAFNNLTINNAAGVTLGANETVGGALTLTAGTLAVGTNTLTLNGAATAAAGTLSSAATGTVNYNQGSNGQTILAGSYGNLTFSNFNKTLASAGTIGIAGIFTPGSGTATASGTTIDFNGAAGQIIPAFNYNNLTASNSGARTLASTGTIGIAGTFTPGTNSYTTTGSTVSFNGAGAQTIPAFTFNNLATATGGTKTLGGAVDVGGSLTIGAGTTLDVSASNFALNVAGTFTRSGTFAPGTGTVTFNGAAAQTVSGTTFNNVVINNAAGVSLNGDTVVNNVLTLTNGNVNAQTFTLSLPAAGTISRTSGYVLGNLKKTFGATGAFTYTVGTANGYSPVDANVTAGAGDLTVKAVQGAQPNVVASTSLQRYWSLTGSGITTNLIFRYLPGDVMGNEAGYRVIKVRAGTPTYFFNAPPTVFVDPAAHTANIQNVSSFSDWTAGQLAPTAASVNLSGRITTSAGRAIAGAKVVVSGGNLTEPRTSTANQLGYYRFTDLPVGDYVLTVSSKRYVFNPATRLINLTEEMTDADFVSQP